jgi:hypothetical protein
MAIGVGIPVEKGYILGGYFDVASPGFDESACKQATSAEASGIVFLVTVFGL